MEHLFSSHTNTFQDGMKLIIKLWLVSFHLGTLKFVKRVNIPRQNETNLLFSSLLKSCVLTLVSFPLETRAMLSSNTGMLMQLIAMAHAHLIKNNL